MRQVLLIAAASLALVASACKEKPKPVDPEQLKHDQAEAALLESEAVFATQLHEDARAEGLLAHAAQLDPAQPMYWLELGASRRRQNNKDGARDAYEKSLALHVAAFERNPKEPVELLHQIEVLVLLRREKDARKLLEQAEREFPDSLEVKHFETNHTLDTMLNDPGLMMLAI